ncbi:MAG: helix-turn-helix transcriptional regulator, partial [Nakamurella sp.]
PAMMQYVSDLSAVGAQIRVARRADHRMMIFDRRIVLVAMAADTLALPYLLISESALVQSFCNQFAATWRVAHSIGITAEDVLDFERVQEILRVLSSGATDESAARQLGVSDRTVRRRVAAVMDLLGATSRFEAGAKAVQAGWL